MNPSALELLKNPMDLPPEFKSWLVKYLEVSPPSLPLAQMLGTAEQVTNAADLSKSALQVFSGPLSTGPTNNGRSTAGLYVERSTAHRLLLTNPAGAVTSTVFGSAEVGDTGWQFRIDSDGTMVWGSGTAVGDTNLYRSQANELKTDDTFVPNGGIYTVRAANANVLENFLAAGDTVPAFKLFAQGAMTWGPGGTGAFDLEIARITSGALAFLELISGDGLGYGAGTGGTVSCASTGSCTLNKPTGKVTSSGAISASSPGYYTVNNSCVQAGDTVIVNLANGAANSQYQVFCVNVSAGSFKIYFFNGTGGAATPVFNFAVIKGATS